MVRDFDAEPTRRRPAGILDGGGYPVGQTMTVVDGGASSGGGAYLLRRSRDDRRAGIALIVLVGACCVGLAAIYRDARSLAAFPLLALACFLGARRFVGWVRIDGKGIEATLFRKRFCPWDAIVWVAPYATRIDSPPQAFVMMLRDRVGWVVSAQFDPAEFVERVRGFCPRVADGCPSLPDDNDGEQGPLEVVFLRPSAGVRAGAVFAGSLFVTLGVWIGVVGTRQLVVGSISPATALLVPVGSVALWGFFAFLAFRQAHWYVGDQIRADAGGLATTVNSQQSRWDWTEVDDVIEVRARRTTPSAAIVHSGVATHLALPSLPGGANKAAIAKLAANLHRWARFGGSLPVADPPPAAGRSTSRRTRVTARRPVQTALFVFGALLVAGSAVILASDWVQADAIVERSVTASGMALQDNRNTEIAFVDIDYDVADVSRQGSVRVDPPGVAVGDRVSIHYDPVDPETVWTDPNNDYPPGTRPGLEELALAAAGLALISLGLEGRWS